MNEERELIRRALACYADRCRSQAKLNKWAGPQHAGHRAWLREQARTARNLAVRFLVPGKEER